MEMSLYSCRKLATKFNCSKFCDGLRISKRHFASSNTSKAVCKEKPVSLAVGSSIGVISGFLGSLCGVGGSLVIIPALKQFSNVTIHRITGTSLAAVSGASIFASVAYIEQGFADIGIASLLGFSAMISSKFGAQMHMKLPKKSLTRMLGLFMLLSVPPLIMKQSNNSQQRTDIQQRKREGGLETPWKFYFGRRAPTLETFPVWLKDNAIYSVVGLATGFSTAMLGVGGGIIMKSVLGTFSPFTQHEAVATSLCAMVPIGMSSAVWHFRAGNVKVRAAGLIGTTSALTMYCTAKYLAPHIDEDTLRKIFAGLLTLSALKMF